MKIDDIITIRIGKNLSRKKETVFSSTEKNQDDGIYSFENLIDDLNGVATKKKDNYKNKIYFDENYLTDEEDVVFSFVSSIASKVGEANKGRLLNQNFAKLIPKSENVDKKYLCYLLNESKEVKKQMKILMQGSTVPKLTPAILRELQVELPNINRQKILGDAYFAIKKRNFKAKIQLEQEEKLLLEILHKSNK